MSVAMGFVIGFLTGGSVMLVIMSLLFLASDHND